MTSEEVAHPQQAVLSPSAEAEIASTAPPGLCVALATRDHRASRPVAPAVDSAVGTPRTAPNGTWEGLVGQLMRGHTDFGLALLMLTTARLNAVDFSLPLVFSRVVVIIQEPKEEEITWNSFLRPFDVRLWQCIIAITALIWAVLRVQRSYRPRVGYHEDYSQTYSDVLHVAGVFFMQGCGGGRDTKSCDSVRASLLVASVSALLVHTAYCGALTASLATHRLKMPFSDLKGLLQDGSYKLLVLYASGEMTIFDNTSDAVLKSVYEKHVEKDKIPIRNKEVFERICNSHKNAAMITDVVYKAYKRSTKCPVISAQEYMSIQTAVVFRKGSPYRELINYQSVDVFKYVASPQDNITCLLQMRSEGLIHRIYWKYWMLRDGQEMRESLKPVTIQSVIPALAVLVATALLSLCLLLLERKTYKRLVLRDAATSTD
ncbi:glutamate receptor ionotropic, kainate glr-3-like [Schistocerca cancellata]|uniref:glutamate receptor ionotropic, kainate glr-3-like n=1 Tax=Schistocerca cancellata TaxID=274614 RepID=UPI0021196F21|nr:glutamate receptor ionotropic, kainate glr-3-like [Schistocerca cancellata]